MEQNDHDNLTTLISSLADFKAIVNEKFADLKADIKDLREGVSTRVTNLEKTKVDRVEIDAVQKRLDDDVEIRLRAVEDFQNNWIGKTSVLVFIISAIVSGIVLWLGTLLKK
jgi:hypothetical protein